MVLLNEKIFFLLSTLQDKLTEHIIENNKIPTKLSQRKKGNKIISYYGFEKPAGKF